MSHRVLVVANPKDAEPFEVVFRGRGVELCVCPSLDEASEVAARASDLIFLASTACEGAVAAAIARLRKHAPETPLYLVATRGAEIPATRDLWFEVVRSPLRPEVVGWIADATFHAEPSRLFKLYLTGSGPYARERSARVSKVLAESLDGQFELELIDILREPHRARMDQVRATPTLIRTGRRPRRHVVPLDDRQLARALDPAEVRW